MKSINDFLNVDMAEVQLLSDFFKKNQNGGYNGQYSFSSERLVRLRDWADSPGLIKFHVDSVPNIPVYGSHNDLLTHNIIYLKYINKLFIATPTFLMIRSQFEKESWLQRVNIYKNENVYSDVSGVDLLVSEYTLAEGALFSQANKFVVKKMMEEEIKFVKNLFWDEL